jgi:hypothetical protein
MSYVNHGGIVGMGWNLSNGGQQVLSFFDSATSVSATITVPSGIRAGDLLVLHDWCLQNGSPPASVVPAGFTSVVDNGSVNTNIRHIISYKISDGTEGGTTLTGMNATNEAKSLLVFRGTLPIQSATPSVWTSVNVLSNPAPQDIFAAGVATPVVLIGCYTSSGVIGLKTFTPTEDAEISAATTHYTKYKIYNSAPQDVNIDMGDTGSNALAGGYFICA